MSDYKFVHNCFYEPNLGAIFQHKSFLDLHNQSSDFFYFEYLKFDKVIASIYFCKSLNDRWRSPLRGTFSGLHFGADVKLNELLDFMMQVEDFMRGHGAKSLEILAPPLAHQTSLNSRQIYLLYSLGYQFNQCDLNYTMTVSPQPFENYLSVGNKKRLKKCRRSNLFAARLPINNLPQVFEVIEKNRKEKGYKVSMTLIELENMANTFSKETYLFGVQDLSKQALIAGAVCFRIYSNVLYVFYWGDLPGYSTLSPIVLLADSIYEFCQVNDLTVLDVGTSTEDKLPNYGLINFKKGLGFEESLKFRMVKNL